MMKIEDHMRTLGLSAPMLKLIGMEKFSDLIPVRLSGINFDVDATDEGIWEAGGVFTWLSSAEKLKVKSSDGKDTAAGVGARTIQIRGLDENYAIQTETVIMTGAVAKETTKEYIRFLDAEVLTAGTELDNAGNITIKDNADALTLGYIHASYNKSSGVFFTVPAGKTLYVCDLLFAETNTKRADFSLVYKEYSSLTTKIMNFSAKNKIVDKNIEIPYKIEEKSDVYMVAQSPDSDAVVSCVLFGFYETN